MIKKVKLKKLDDYVLLDEDVYEYLINHEHYGKIKLLENLRRHSSGCVVFQKLWRNADKSHWIETIYLHKLIAETFLPDLKTKKNNLAGVKNGNKYDLRKENIVWRSRGWASRQRKTVSKTGYMGVYAEGKKYRAVISTEGKSYHLGMFETKEEAALAYNKKSWELFGHEGNQNPIPEDKLKEILAKKSK